MADTPNFNNPLLKAVKEKAYSAPNVAVNPNELNMPIPEPTFRPEPIDVNQDLYGKLNDEQGPLTGSMPGPTGQPMNDLPGEDKEQGAENLADLIINGYAELNKYGEKLLRIPQRKINKLQQEGVINLSAAIAVGNEVVSAAQIIDDFNEQTNGTFAVSKEFKREVKPVLKRVLEKRGAKLTDEQMLLYLFGKDIAVKTIILFQMKAQTAELIEAIKLASEQGHAQAPVTPQPQAPKQQPQAMAEQPTFVQHMETPNMASGRDSVKQRRKLDRDIENTTRKHGPSSYDEALKSKKTGVRGRKKKKDTPLEYIDEAEIAAQIKIEETNESQESGMD